MSGFVVMVDFQIKPEMTESFRALVSENARNSLAHEPGCRRFDVVLPRGQAGHVFLYEVYDDEAAFEAHKATPHFLQFERETVAHVAVKKVSVGVKHFPNELR